MGYAGSYGLAESDVGPRVGPSSSIRSGGTLSDFHLDVQPSAAKPTALGRNLVSTRRVSLPDTTMEDSAGYAIAGRAPISIQDAICGHVTHLFNFDAASQRMLGCQQSSLASAPTGMGAVPWWLDLMPDAPVGGAPRRPLVCHRG
ncbi:hypothetical protein BP6252_08151 [Coleophoma cylindrospora]|uniref:Uncharacterized protein n=1 Tax=Coleophoma cylindrospora TaxID=1849047 RepID=A0A3D8RCD9_9HELO|nr:hypothetical protein BP6252_08151 [Coleophoma cylindrospora]